MEHPTCTGLNDPSGTAQYYCVSSGVKLKPEPTGECPLPSPPVVGRLHLGGVTSLVNDAYTWSPTTTVGSNAPPASPPPLCLTPFTDGLLLEKTIGGCPKWVSLSVLSLMAGARILGGYLDGLLLLLLLVRGI